jgi:hypothetical protein
MIRSTLIKQIEVCGGIPLVECWWLSRGTGTSTPSLALPFIALPCPNPNQWIQNLFLEKRYSYARRRKIKRKKRKQRNIISTPPHH